MQPSCGLAAVLLSDRVLDAERLKPAGGGSWGAGKRVPTEGGCRGLRPRNIRRASDGEPLSGDVEVVSWWACQSGCRPKGLVVVVTRETAAGTFSLVCTSVRAVSEDGAEQWDVMLELMG